MMGVLMRRARKADAPVVHALLWSAKDGIPLNDNFADNAHQKWVEDQFRSRSVWIADHAGVIAGAMVIKPNEISYLVVDTKKRRTGIGKTLIAHAKKLWKTGLRARVKPYNTKIIGLLESTGFESETSEDTTGYDWVWYRWCPIKSL